MDFYPPKLFSELRGIVVCVRVENAGNPPLSEHIVYGLLTLGTFFDDIIFL